MAGGAAVRLHVYDASKNRHIGKANQFLVRVGTGVFHSSIEVYGNEWGYGGNFTPGATGVYCSEPGHDQQHVHREVIDLGPTSLSEREVERVLERLEREWLGVEYDLLRHNCSHFTVALCEGLGVGPVPAWITSLAAVGAEAEAVAEVAMELGKDLLQHLRCWDSFLSVHGPDLGPDCRKRVAGNLLHFRANYLLVTCIFMVMVLLGRPMQLLFALALTVGFLLALRHAPAEAAGSCTTAMTAASAALSLMMLREALFFCALMALLHAASHPGDADATKAGLREKSA